VRDERTAIVIITRDRADELIHTLGRLHELPERPDVVVVDQGSRDETVARVRRSFPAVRLEELGCDRGAAGRNAGVRAVEAPYVAFCDDDSWWAPGALARAADVLDAHPDVALVAARVLLNDEQRLDPACAAMASSPLAPDGDAAGTRVLGFVACGAVVRRTAFLAVGGFHPALGVGAEEQLLAVDLATAGWRLVYRHDVVAHHHPSPIRDRPQRRTMQIRNDLWFTWLRRAPRAVWRVTLRACWAAARERSARTGLLHAVLRGRWVLEDRRRVPAWVEADLCKIDRS
jgi:GT2 family glycosyltransferase